jgi:hypothetical protein
VDAIDEVFAMSLFASFNGGPSDQAVLFALVGSGLIGPIVGGIAAYKGKRFWQVSLLAPACAMIVTGLFLIGGNERGDAAGMFLMAALVIFIPVSGFIGLLGGCLSAGLVTFFRRPSD